MDKSLSFNKSFIVQIVAIIIFFGCYFYTPSRSDGGVAWITILVCIFSFALLASIFIPLRRQYKHGIYIFVGLVFIIIAYATLLDAYDESVVNYGVKLGDGIDNGNGFLADGLGQFAYVFTTVPSMIIGCTLLGLNSYLKFKEADSTKKSPKGAARKTK